jgi:hypothetical protein
MFLFELCNLGNSKLRRNHIMDMESKDLEGLEKFLSRYKDTEEYATTVIQAEIETGIKRNQLMILGLEKYDWSISGIDYYGWVSREDAIWWLKSEYEKGPEAALIKCKNQKTNQGLTYFDHYSLEYLELENIFLRAKIAEIGKLVLQKNADGSFEDRLDYKKDLEIVKLEAQVNECLKAIDVFIEERERLKKLIEKEDAEKKEIDNKIQKLAEKYLGGNVNEKAGSEGELTTEKSMSSDDALLQLAALKKEQNSILLTMIANYERITVVRKEIDVLAEKAKEFNKQCAEKMRDYRTKKLNELQGFVDKLSTVDSSIKKIKGNGSMIITPAVETKVETDIPQKSPVLSEQDKLQTTPAFSMHQEKIKENDMEKEKEKGEKTQSRCLCVIM